MNHGPGCDGPLNCTCSIPVGASRTVDETGLVWQARPAGGERTVGEVHRTRAGRYYVVMMGRRIAERLATFAEAVDAALAWTPEGEDAELLALRLS